MTPTVDANLDPIVDEIKKSHPPAEAALEFCKWVTEHVKYDASVPYDTSDLAAILKNQKGHCGHQMATFEAMCTRAGIPTRTIVGLNLNTPGGVGPSHEIRPDFQNQHTWAQIYLPGSGWVEIDPGQGADSLFSSRPSSSRTAPISRTTSSGSVKTEPASNRIGNTERQMAFAIRNREPQDFSEGRGRVKR